jgi:hypothetical protein
MTSAFEDFKRVSIAVVVGDIGRGPRKLQQKNSSDSMKVSGAHSWHDSRGSSPMTTAQSAVVAEELKTVEPT